MFQLPTSASGRKRVERRNRRLLTDTILLLESLVVGGMGLEPILFYQLDPKSSASANSATRPQGRLSFRIACSGSTKATIPGILNEKQFLYKVSASLRKRKITLSERKPGRVRL